MKITAHTTEQLEILLEVVKAIQEMRNQQIDWTTVIANDDHNNATETEEPKWKTQKNAHLARMNATTIANGGKTKP